MNRLLAALAVFLALAGAAWAQGGAIQQSGAITAHHVGGWFGNGVLGDAGTPASPGLSAVGIYDGPQCPFGVSSQTQPGGPVGPYSIFTICQTNTTSTLTFGAVGQPYPSVYFNIGGINYGFPGPGNGNVDGPPGANANDLVCFNTASGTLLEDCGFGVLNIAAAPYNADPTGAADSTAGINAAAAVALSSGQSLLIPCGTFKHSGLLVFNAISVHGFGACSVLESTDTTASNPNTAIEIEGAGVSLSDLSITTTWSGSRQTNSQSAAIWAAAPTNWTVAKVAITGSASAGIADIGGVEGIVRDNIIQSTLADGIINTAKAANLSISGNKLVSTGDDCISIVSYVSDGGLVDNVTETNNQCINGSTRGFTVVGGNNVTIDGGLIVNPVDNCLYIASDSFFLTYGDNNVTVTGLVEDTCGVNSSIVLAANLIAGRSGYPVSHVVIDGLVATNIRYVGVEAGVSGDYTSDVTLANSHLYGLGGASSGVGVYASGVTDLDVHDTSIANFTNEGFATDTSSDNGGFLKFDNDHIFQVNTGIGLTDAVHIFQSGFGTVDIRGLTQTNGSTTVNYLISNDVVNSIIENDTGDNTTINTPGTGSTMPLRMVTVHEGQASIIPSTTACAVGDRVWNTNPGISVAPGWICTTAGSPGTWSPMSNFARTGGTVDAATVGAATPSTGAFTTLTAHGAVNINASAGTAGTGIGTGTTTGQVTIGGGADQVVLTTPVGSSGPANATLFLGTYDATSYIVADFDAGTPGEPSHLQLTDGATYNSCIGTDASGDFEYRASCLPGSDGAQEFLVTTTGAVNLPGISNAAGNEILCYDTTAGPVTYESAVSGCVPSDPRVKDKGRPINPQDALRKIETLTLGTGRYKPSQHLGSGEHVWLYADEVCAVDKRLCVPDAHGILNYDKTGLLVYAIGAIQAQQQEIDALKREVHYLEHGR